MNSRERLETTLRHEPPDKVPLDLGGNQTGIHRVAYNKVLDYYGFDEEIVVMDIVQQLAAPSEAVLQAFEIDTRYIRPGMFQPQAELQEVKPGFWGVKDGFGIVWAMPGERPGEGLYCDIVEHPLQNMKYEDLDHYPWPDGKDPSPFKGLREYAKRMHEETDYALVSGITGVVFEICWYMRGLEALYIDMLEQPRYVEKLLDHTLQYWSDYLETFLAEVGEYLQVICVGDDLAMQSGPLFSPDLYRSLVKPRQKALYTMVREKTSANLWYHSCGSVVDLLPDIVDNGVQILNPVQISAKDMHPETLKKQYGENLTFWGGGIDTQHVYASGTPEEVREQVRDLMGAFKPGGGYVFNTVHNTQADVPVENIVGLWEAAKEFRAY